MSELGKEKIANELFNSDLLFLVFLFIGQVLIFNCGSLPVQGCNISSTGSANFWWNHLIKTAISQCLDSLHWLWRLVAHVALPEKARNGVAAFNIHFHTTERFYETNVRHNVNFLSPLNLHKIHKMFKH